MDSAVSSDGQWIYLPTGEGSFMTIGEHAGRFLVINARTLKIDKVIQLQGQAHHASAYRTPDGEPRSILYGWSQPMFVLDPDDDNRVVGRHLPPGTRQRRLPVFRLTRW